jgi:hypothetical protein
MMSLGDIASKLGVPVFPCGGNKRPVVETGFKAATADAGEIVAMFARPGAELIGMPTGRASGLIAIDIDIRPGHTGMDWLTENENALPETRTHKTRSGGLHLLFLAPEGVEIRNSASRLAPGVDVRGEGGYIILPPSPGYAVADDSEPAEMPRWLIRACLPPEPQAAPVQPPAPRQATRHGGTAYGLKGLDNECHAVTRAPFGRQEPALNEAGLKVGALIAGGELEEGPAVAELLAAARGIASEPGREPWTPAEIEKKVRRAVQDGKARPRQAPPRATPLWDRDAPLEDDGYLASLDQLTPDDGEPDVVPPEGAQDRTKGRTALPLVYFDAIERSLDVRDFVQGLLVEQSSAVLYGESNSGKTFFATALALCVAAGVPFFGRRVEQGGVLYLALEGGQGFRNRIAAWRERYDALTAPVHFVAVPSQVNLLHPDADTPRVIAAAVEAKDHMGAPIKLIVVDTLARAMAGGNENAPEDMGALVMNMDKIREQTGATVLFIHHSGKDAAKGARGHSSLRAAIDTEIEVEASDGPVRRATVVKQRDMRKGDVFGFELEVVELGPNRHGEPVTTCLMSETDAGPAVAKRQKLSGNTQIGMDALVDVMSRAGDRDMPGVPANVPSVPEAWWREKFYEIVIADNQDTKKKAFQRAAADLQGRHLVGSNRGRVWLVRHSKETGQ